MTSRRRKAEFVSNLVVFDEPHLLCLKSKKTMILALAVERSERFDFDWIAVSVSGTNWERYVNSNVDVRYLFAFPFQRTLYFFSDQDLDGSEIWLKSFSDEFSSAELPDEILPDSGLFFSDNTEDYAVEVTNRDEEKLFIDGEWELNEFGHFYQKYSDIYAFDAAVKNYKNAQPQSQSKVLISRAFGKRPFQGGSSYLHTFNDLHACLPKGQRLALDGIEYNSPGDVRINGSEQVFSQVEGAIQNFLEHRTKLYELNKEIKDYIKKANLFSVSAQSFSNSSPHSNFLEAKANKMFEALKIADRSTIFELCQDNALVFSKIALAVYRRIDTAAKYFAEGRMAFERD